MTKKSLTPAGQSSLSSAPAKKPTVKKPTPSSTQDSSPPDSAKPSAPKKTSSAKAKPSATKTSAKAVSKATPTTPAKAAASNKTPSPAPAKKTENADMATVDSTAGLSQHPAETSAAPAAKKPASGVKKTASATKKTPPSRQTAKATVSDAAASSPLTSKVTTPDSVGASSSPVKEVESGKTSSENLAVAKTVAKKAPVSPKKPTPSSAKKTSQTTATGVEVTAKQAETIAVEANTASTKAVGGAPAAAVSEKKAAPQKKSSGSSSKAPAKTSAKSVTPEEKDTVSTVASVPESIVPVLSGDSEGNGPSEGTTELSTASEEEQPTGRRRSRSRRGRGRRGGGSSTEKNEATDSGQEAEPMAEAADATPQSEAEKLSRRKMLVSVQPGEQVEVVISEEGQVQEYYIEMLQQVKTKGNIYKAVIHNVDPNLQAAFISYGAHKNGFLQIDEVHPEYYCVPHEPAKGRKYPPIQKVLKVGQELLVQVVKEPTGTKGAFLTTYLSLPGRFLVLTPGREQIGVSRKVDHDEERARLREMLEGLSPGAGLGVIVRTVSMGTNKNNLQKDLQNLKKKWKEVRQRGTTEKSPCLIYQEMDLTTRAVRDYLTDQVAEVWLDDEQTFISVAEIASDLFPRKKNLVRLHKENTSLFERFNIQRQLDQIFSREVQLPSGGRLVVDPTEALTAIDINSGRSSGKNNFEDMAYRTNLEAAKMIPLQLRLRDIGGQVVIDFIEMRDKTHWREIEKTLRAGMKIDRARYDIGKIGPFGMLELVRQRLGSSAISVSMEVCPCCRGLGVRHNMEWQSQQALKDMLRKLRALQGQDEFVYEADPSLAMHLLNYKRQRLSEMEQETGITLIIQPKG